jgi:hypothetical protein
VIEVKITALELEQKPANLGRELNGSLTIAERIPCFDYVAIYDGPKVYETL